MSSLPATFTPGLPPAGAQGAYFGRDAQGNIYLLRWHETNGWEALGWTGAGKAAMPALRHPAGQDQGLIVGHAEMPSTQTLHGPFGHLVGPVDLDERYWRIDDDPYREPGYFSLPMFTQVDPFTLMQKREVGR